MRHVYKSCLVLLLVITTSTFIFTGCQQREENETEENDEYDGPDKAIEFEIERTRDLSTGKVPWEKLRVAMEQTEQSKMSSSNLVNALSWIERGPDGDFSGPQGNTRPNADQTSGRIRASMIDSLDPTHKTVWIGGVDGGLWKTTDITASPSNWVPVNDFLSNLAVAAICQDPRPGFQNNMYFCTGESYSNADAVRGVGVFKSTDGGATWNFLSSTSSYLNGTRILCDYQGNVYLGTRGTGLLRSTNGGTTWTNITPATLGSNICDLEISSTATAGRLHVASGIFSASGYSYTDAPATVTTAGWTAPTTAFTSFNSRVELAISDNVLYALPCSNSSGTASLNYQVNTIWKSTDGGANWAATAGQPTSGWASQQGWYALSAGINPSNPNECIVGGLDCFKTINGGTSWTKISTWVGTTGQYVHADQHNIQWWDGGNKLMFNCDGGVHYSNNGGTTITDRNKGLRIKQFYSIAIHPTQTNYFLSGAQDNGVHRLNHPGLDSSVEVYGGDGCYVAIDQNEPQYQFGSYVYNVYRRSTNNGVSWSTPVNLGTTGSNGRFVNPFDYDNNGNVFYACYTANNYLRWDDPQTGGTTTIVSAPGLAGTVSAVHASPYTPNKVYFGMGNGGIAQVDNANTGTTATATLINSGAGMPAGYVNCVVTGADDQHLIACFSNYGVQNVWITTNGGTTWTAIDGNLPDMPVRWALFHPDTDTKAFIATETGVWETDLINGAATVWTANTTFPNVRTDMIKYRSSDRTIAAGTHGRGIWSAIITPSGCTAASVTSQPSNAAACAGNNATFTIAGSGTGYQWQESINGGGSWGNITNGGVYSGATTTSLTLTGITAGMNNYRYRCVAIGSCVPTSVNSNAAVLTVNAATTISVQPLSSISCAGATTSFSVTAAGTSLSYQWQQSINSGGTWTTVNNGGIFSGAATSTLTITGVTAGMNTYQYRCVIGSACTPLNSNAAILTVNTPPAVSAQPTNTAVCAGNAAGFSVSATGSGLTYQWQESTNGGGTWNNLSNTAPYSGVTTVSLNIAATTVAMNSYQYRCVISGTCPSAATSLAGILTVGTALSITSQPTGSTVCAGATTSFTVATTGTVISYQWQESTNGGGTWNNISNGGIYSGATTVNLTLTGITGTMNNNQYRCVVTGSCPAINSTAAVLTVNTTPAVTAQPINNAVCATQNSTFTVAATGTGISYQWQVSISGCGGPWNNVLNAAPYSGATTASLTITNTPATMNGYAYRCIISGTCAPSATTSCATLTVNTAVNITAQPANATLCAGANTSFSVTATGTTPTYQWQESTNGGTSWTNITNGGVYSGATTNTLALTAVTAAMNSYQYRSVVSGATSCSSLNSGNATLTVNTAPAISVQPVSGTTICSGQNTSFSVTANGTALLYQWQLSTDNGTTWNNITNGGNYSGATTGTLSITAATVAMNNYRYRNVISGTCLPAVNSTAAILTVNTPISVTTAPANAIICATGTTSFTTAAAGTSPTYQWQVSTNGGTTWTNLNNGGIYSGATSTTLVLTGITAAMNGYLYRAVISGTTQCGAINSSSASLTVSAQPSVTLTAAPYTKLLPGLTTNITASVNPAAGFTTVWTWNNTPVSVLGNSYTVDVNHLGTYTVVATIGSCISVPATIVISDSVSSKLFIYPSPNDGKFTVAYYNQGATATKQIVTIFSTKGEKVYNKEFNVTQAYQLLDIDLRRNGSGVYYVVLSDTNGKIIKRGEVLVR